MASDVVQSMAPSRKLDHGTAAGERFRNNGLGADFQLVPFHVVEILDHIVTGRDDIWRAIGGNVSLNKELDMIETINGMLRNGYLSGDHHYTGITIRMVGIEEEDDDLDLAYASKFNRRPDFSRLFDLGRNRAPRFYEDGSLRDQFIRRLTRSARPAR